MSDTAALAACRQALLSGGFTAGDLETVLTEDGKALADGVGVGTVSRGRAR